MESSQGENKCQNNNYNTGNPKDFPGFCVDRFAGRRPDRRGQNPPVEEAEGGDDAPVRVDDRADPGIRRAPHRAAELPAPLPPPPRPPPRSRPGKSPSKHPDGAPARPPRRNREGWVPAEKSPSPAVNL